MTSVRKSGGVGVVRSDEVVDSLDLGFRCHDDWLRLEKELHLTPKVDGCRK
jgi:hypothetical protein